MNALRADALALQAELGGRAVDCRPEEGWPPDLALRLPGDQPAYEWPCPYGNFAWVRLTDRAMERLGDSWDWRDLLTLAAYAPDLCR